MKRLPYVLSAVLLSVAIGTAAWMGRSRYDLWFAERGLNEFYRQHRPFAYRWPGTPYGVQGPPVLSEGARKQLDGISLRLELWRDKLASDVHWLRLRGRVALLDGNYDRAVTQYRRARLLSRNDPSITAELAVAYALRAVAEKRATDYGAALNYAAEAASGKTPPSFTLFNLAVLTEDIPLPRVALEQWQAAVEAETVSAWQAEVEARKKQLAQKLETRRRNHEALRDPSAIHTPLVALPGALEVMQQEALQNWVLMQPPPREALQFLGDAFSKHKDNWWRDFLSVPFNEEANQLLSQTIFASAEGRYADAENAGAKAEAAFLRTGNVAGRLRARWERITASHLGDSTLDCEPLLLMVADQLSSRAYKWLGMQVWLDEITCRNLHIRAPHNEGISNAFEATEHASLEGVSLRALLFLAEPEVSPGSAMEAWSRGRQGLARFWTSLLPDYRASQFSWNLAQIAELSGYSQGRRLLLLESALNLVANPNRGFRASMLGDLAVSEASIGHSDKAARHLIEARSLLTGSPTERYRYQIEIEDAGFEAAAGRPEAALKRLEGLQSRTRLASAPNELDRADLLNEAGKTYLQLARWREAESAFKNLMMIYEPILSNRSTNSGREAIARKFEAAFRGLIEAQIRLGSKPAASLAGWLKFRAGFSGAEFTNKHLATDSSLLALAVLPGGISAWLANDDGVEQHWIEGGPINPLAARLTGLASDPEAAESAVRAAAREMEAALLSHFESPLASRGSSAASTLLIDADAVLQKIPWPLLENEKGESLIQRYSLVQVAGRMPMPNAAQKPITSRTPSFVMADPALDRSDGDLVPLKEALSEGLRVAKRFRSCTMVNGAAATLDAFVKYAPTVGLLHFAGHGISNGGLGGLLLAGKPKFLTAEQISSLPLNELQLVVLSSCSSGVSEDTSSVDSDLLMRSFLNAGAKRVLASGWAVDSLATSQLMDLFYAKLLAGRTPARALRESVLELRSHSVGAHPSAWAAFQLYGEP